MLCWLAGKKSDAWTNTVKGTIRTRWGLGYFYLEDSFTGFQTFYRKQEENELQQCFQSMRSPWEQPLALSLDSGTILSRKSHHCIRKMQQSCPLPSLPKTSYSRHTNWQPQIQRFSKNCSLSSRRRN